MAWPLPGIESEVHLDCDHGWNRSGSVFQSGLELVLPDRFDRIFIQSHAKRAHDANILRVALGVDDQRDDAHALVTGAPCLV